MVGTHLMFWIFGGDSPGHQIIARRYWVHVLVLPALMIALLRCCAGASRPVGTPDPAGSAAAFTCAVLVLLGTIAQINPVWLFGPYQPGSISAGVGARTGTWAFLDGALRIMPGWELRSPGIR